jgi:hypothetical protein
VKSCHDRHFEAHQQRDDMASGFATENSELVLEADDIEAFRNQSFRRAYIILTVLVGDLKPEDRVRGSR